MPITPAPALLVAPPGHLWEGLRQVLANCPDISLASEEARDQAQTLALMRVRVPALVVLDFGLAEDVLMLLADIKSAWPATQCLVIAENCRQLELGRAAGADGVLLRGFQTKELYAAIHGLLQPTSRTVENK